MSMSNTITRIIVLLVVLFGMPPLSLAALNVTFEATPLFSNADVKPGDSVSRTVTVANTGSESEDVIADLTNTFSDGLADVMNLSIASGGATFADTSFADLFTVDPIALDALAPGDIATYTFTASLPRTVGNEYQLATLGFDVVIGFAGGEQTSDVTRTFGVGGGTSGGQRFELFNERVASVAQQSALVAWNTNRDSSSYVVCGNLDDGPFRLQPEAEFFGYSFAVPEVAADTVTHGLVVPDLVPGTYECRPASREAADDDFLVGIAVQFTILPPDGLVAGASTTLPPVVLPQQSGSVLGVSKAVDGLSQEAYEDWLAAKNARAEAATAAAETPSPASFEQTTEETSEVVPTATDEVNRNPIVLGVGGLVLLLLLGWIVRRVLLQ